MLPRNVQRRTERDTAVMIKYLSKELTRTVVLL